MIPSRKLIYCILIPSTRMAIVAAAGTMGTTVAENIITIMTTDRMRYSIDAEWMLLLIHDFYARLFLMGRFLMIHESYKRK